MSVHRWLNIRFKCCYLEMFNPRAYFLTSVTSLAELILSGSRSLWIFWPWISLSLSRCTCSTEVLLFPYHCPFLLDFMLFFTLLSKYQFFPPYVDPSYTVRSPCFTLSVLESIPIGHFVIHPVFFHPLLPVQPLLLCLIHI